MKNRVVNWPLVILMLCLSGIALTSWLLKFQQLPRWVVWLPTLPAGLLIVGIFGYFLFELIFPVKGWRD